MHPRIANLPAEGAGRRRVAARRRLRGVAKRGEHNGGDALMAKLTLRESQVLERIVAGRLNKQIADDLGISIKTVEAHRANIMEKLNANTVADLLKTALGQNAAKP